MSHAEAAMVVGRPRVYDLYCGLGGWSKGFIAEGWEAVGFDIEEHRYPRRVISEGPVKRPGMDWSDRTKRGSRDAQFNRPPELDPEGGWVEYPGELRLRDVLTIHGSELADADMIVGSSPCQEFSYRAMPWKRAKALPPPELGIRLFEAQFRIQREASEAAGRYIPMVVENVKGAQKWVGRAKWHYGSYYLWGDVPALMPSAKVLKVAGFNFHQHERGGKGGSFQSAAVTSMKNGGNGSWFAIGSPGQKQTGSNPDGRKVGGDWFGFCADMKANGTISPGRLHGKGSPARKAASAMIAEIPWELARWIAHVYYPAATPDRRSGEQEAAC